MYYLICDSGVYTGKNLNEINKKLDIKLEEEESKELKEKVNEIKLPMVPPEFEDDHLESTHWGQIVKEKRAFLAEYW